MLQELNLAGNNATWGPPGTGTGDMSGIAAIADVVGDMGAISSINLLGNYIPVKQAQELVKIMQAKETLTTLCGLSKEETKLDFRGQNLGAGDAVRIASDIRDMGALTSLHVGRNRIPEKEMRKILAIAMRMGSMKILCKIPFKDKSLSELDVSGKNLGMEGALVVADYFDGNGALTSLDVSSNKLGSLSSQGGWVKEAGVQYCSPTGTYQHKKPAGENFKAEGLIALTNAIRDNGALTRLDISNNQFCDDDGGAPAGKAISDMLAVNSTLRELDVSGNAQYGSSEGGPAFAQALSVGISGNGALSTLRLKDNQLATKEAGKALAAALAGNSVLTELDVSSNNWYYNSGNKGDGAGFAQELAAGIKDMGALSKLVMRQNDIHGAEAGRAFADMLAQNTVLKELDLSSQKVGDYGKPMDVAFAKEFAAGISGNGALAKLDISNNDIGQGGSLLLIIEMCDTKGIELGNDESESDEDYI
jgi:Leucine-rich repeat (LRR) protein